MTNKKNQKRNENIYEIPSRVILSSEQSLVDLIELLTLDLNPAYIYKDEISLNPAHALEALEKYYQSFSKIDQEQGDFWLAKGDAYYKTDVHIFEVKPRSNYGNFFDKSRKYYWEATKYYENMEKEDSTNINAWNNNGISLCKLKQGWYGRDCFKKAIELDPENGKIINNLAIAYSFYKEFDLAEEKFKLAIEKNPSNDKIYSNFAVMLQAIGKIEEANKMCDEALKLNKDSFIANYCKGVINRANANEAIKYLKVARELNITKAKKEEINDLIEVIEWLWSNKT